MAELTSASRVQRLHSSWTALMGCTACAARISAGLASLRPKYLTLPSFTSSYALVTHGCVAQLYEGMTVKA